MAILFLFFLLGSVKVPEIWVPRKILSEREQCWKHEALVVGLRMRVGGTTKADRGRAGKRHAGSTTGCHKGGGSPAPKGKVPRRPPPSHIISSKFSASQPVRMPRGRRAAHLQAVDLKIILGGFLGD